MKKILTLLALLSVVVLSCSKDQKVVKQLEGDWTVTNMTRNGTAVAASEYSGMKYTFENCKVKKGDCDGTLSVPDSTKGTYSQAFTYNIQDKGEIINIKFSILGLTATAVVGTIEEHSDSKFVYSYTESQGTDKIVETLTKN
jgi:hypothetical protein